MKKVYYSDLLNDDFAGNNIKTKEVPNDFEYQPDKNIIFRGVAFFLYNIIAKPLVWLILRIGFPFSSIKNKKVLKQVKGTGFFLYGNHTSILPDAFNPNIISWHKNYIIVNPDATSIKGIKTIVMMFGALPLGNTPRTIVNLNKCIHKRIEQKRIITIYPEAHIWPYYTKIRPFSEKSFYYQVRENVPCFCLTTCYSKYTGILKFIKRPKITTYIDGPFYPDENLDKDERMKKIRDEVYNTMCQRVEKYSTYEYIQYIKKED